jgi:hypothetical protein
VYTRWDSKESFESWLSSPAFTHGHRSSSEGGPVGTASEVWTYDVIQHEDATGYCPHTTPSSSERDTTALRARATSLAAVSVWQSSNGPTGSAEHV